MPPACTPTDCDAGLCATDRYSDGCAEYAKKPYTCGTFDVPGFSSMAMCCACGGGDTISPPAPPPQVDPFPPPAGPPARPPLAPLHISLQGGDDLSDVFASDLAVEVIELEPNQHFSAKGAIAIGSRNISITLSSLASSGAKRPMIEVDTDEPFVSVGPGGSFSLSGVGVVRSAASLARRRRRLAAGLSDTALVNSVNGTLTIANSELRSEDSLVLSSIGESGDLTISSSVISGRVFTDKGKVH